MKRAEVHALWANDDDPWRPWVKPVLFASLPDEVTPSPEPHERVERDARELVAALEQERGYREGPVADAALVLDLPGAASVELGVALAAHGFRPVPLFNALPAPSDTGGIVDQRPIMRALVDHAAALGDQPKRGAPCFLLDSHRLGREGKIAPNVYDNRSVCRLADFPSPEALRVAGVRRFVVVCSGALQMDLAAILFAWQSAGVIGHRFIDDGKLTALTVRRPSLLRRLLEVARHGLIQQRPDGSFGRLLPASAQGG